MIRRVPMYRTKKIGNYRVFLDDKSVIIRYKGGIVYSNDWSMPDSALLFYNRIKRISDIEKLLR